MVGIGIGPGFQAARVPTASAPGITLASLPVTPAARWHPGFSTVVTSGGRVVSATDLMGLAGLTEGAGGNGPQALTDANGRKFWRFQDSEFLNIAAALVTDNRAVSAFFVGRHHRAGTPAPVLWGGNVAQGSQLSGGGIVGVATASNGAPIFSGAGRSGSLDATNARWMVAGSQMQVMGVVSRTTANGGITLWMNERKAFVGQNTIARPVLTGGEIGRNPTSTSVLGGFDLYELVLYPSALTDPQGDTIQAALLANYAIPSVAHQIVMDGDSITQGTGAVTSGLSAAMILTEIGAGLIPANWRVVNMGLSGNQVADLVLKRDAATAWAAYPVTGGQNVLAVEIGRNDFAGGLAAAQHYANVVAYLNTATTGVLQRGWTVRVMANIATSGMVVQTAYRALIREAQFLTDTQTQTGGAFAGKLSIISTDLIEDAGQSVFLTAADAADTTYYAGDNTHPSLLGARLRIDGGQTPQHGVAMGL